MISNTGCDDSISTGFGLFDSHCWARIGQTVLPDVMGGSPYIPMPPSSVVASPSVPPGATTWPYYVDNLGYASVVNSPITGTQRNMAQFVQTLPGSPDTSSLFPGVMDWVLPIGLVVGFIFLVNR